MVEPALFGPLDSLLGPIIKWILLGLVVANLGTRALANRTHRKQAQHGEEISRHGLHQALNVVLVLAALYFATVEYHAGMVTAVLVLGMVIADFFEFEARKVEARGDKPIERPKGSLFVSVLLLAYVAYLTVFFVVEPVWSAIV